LHWGETPWRKKWGGIVGEKEAKRALFDILEKGKRVSTNRKEEKEKTGNNNSETDTRLIAKEKEKGCR